MNARFLRPSSRRFIDVLAFAVLAAVFGIGGVQVVGVGPASLDPEFRPGFTLRPREEVLSVVPDGHGRLLVAHGIRPEFKWGSEGGRVERLLDDGSLDPDFTAPETSEGAIRVVALGAGKTWYAGGDFPALADSGSARLARFHEDGSVDPTFIGATNLAPLRVNVVGVPSDGKVWVGGWFGIWNGVPTRNLVRLESNGEVDRAFVERFNASSGSAVGTISQIALRADGKVLVAGGFHALLDIDGTVLSRLPPAGHYALQPDGAVLLANQRVVGGEVRGVGIQRFLVDGRLDPDFNLSVPIDGFLSALDQQPDGRLLLMGGFNVAGGQRQPRLARLRPDGTVDAGFVSEVGFTEVRDEVWSGSGVLTGSDWVSGSHTLADGALLIYGNFTQVGGVPVPGLARLKGGAAEVGPPRLTKDASEVRMIEGHLARLGFRVESAVPFAARWTRDGIPVPRAEAPVLVIENTRMTDAGDYQLTVSNALGTATSQVLRLEVDIGPTHPGSLDVTFSPAPAASPMNAPIGGAAFSSDGSSIFVFGPEWPYWGSGFEVWGDHPTMNIAKLFSDGGVDRGFVAFRGLVGWQEPTVQALIPLRDGRLLVSAKLAPSIGGVMTTNTLLALHANGSIDPAFLPEAVTRRFDIPIGPFAETRDRRLLVAGDLQLPDGSLARLARLLPNGRLDPEFLPWNASAGEVRALGQQSDGRLLVAVSGAKASGASLLLRLFANGAPDASFTANLQARAIADLIVDPEDRVLVMQDCLPGDPEGPVTLLVRLLPDGTSDQGFEVSLHAEYQGNLLPKRGLAIQADGRILLHRLGPGGEQPSMIRLFPNGRLDPSFVLEPGFDPKEVSTILPTPDGPILIAGDFSSLDGRRRWGVARLNGYDERELHDPRVQDGQFAATLSTRTGRRYIVESAPTPAGPSWEPVKEIAGDGRPARFSEPAGVQGYYRLRLESPAP